MIQTCTAEEKGDDSRHVQLKRREMILDKYSLGEGDDSRHVQLRRREVIPDMYSLGGGR